MCLLVLRLLGCRCSRLPRRWLRVRGLSARRCLPMVSTRRRARQLDAAGNSGLSSAHTFTVDAGVPQVSIAQPSAGQVLSQGAVVVGGSASSASGDGPSVTVRVYAGSRGVRFAACSRDTALISSGAWQLTTPALADGSYSVQAEHSDSAGHSTLSTAVAFSVDSVAPVVSLVAPVDGAVLSSATPVLSGGGGSAVGDDSTVSVDVFAGSAASGVPVQSLTAPVAAGAWSVSAAVLADGLYTARARQLDAAGNSGLSSAHTFTVDAGVPQVSISQPSAGQVLSQGAVVVGGSASSASGDGPSVTVRVYAGF